MFTALAVISDLQCLQDLALADPQDLKLLAAEARCDAQELNWLLVAADNIKRRGESSYHAALASV